MHAPSAPLRVLHGLNRAYQRALFVLGAGLMGLMLAVVCLQIFARYVLGDSLSWSEELSRFLLVWITFLFAGISFARGEMIAVEMFTARLPRVLQAVFMALGGLATVTLFALLTWYGYDYAEWNRVQTSSALQVSMYYVYLAVPVGSALLVLHVLVGTCAQVLRTLRGENV
ncbi:TRAP transporter small permease [Alkalilimnicola sp. S0819]|uniref:TRAP transporter small permease n=1 Tax=Alkalilimnicola sp. S0819 TaxID=2613922 RepID=UPI0012623CDF|nr:TRAP transporter small permease [Alkalilimnicola sp. S0819]KAB7623678.1 TRAP transporter small permease [Alkalilimnicola sp. S0819]MPQ16805.1 TRAP transporter small permease subunit [Alkalilimnicola sp. S0819]